MLDPEQKDMIAEAELLLYFADRVQHIHQVILPALNKGKIVLCDRFFDATMAYQGYARGLDKNRILSLHRLFCQDLIPNATLLLDLDVETGLKRAWAAVNNGGRTVDETRFESHDPAFHQRVRQGYLDLAKRHENRFWIVDASKDKDSVFKQIRTILSDLIQKRNQVGFFKKSGLEK